MIIHQAGPMNFLRTLLIILLIYYITKFVVRLFGPFLLKKVIDKAQKKAQRRYGNGEETTVEEGKTVIDRKATNVKKSNNDVGEYVDFEEIE